MSAFLRFLGVSGILVFCFGILRAAPVSTNAPTGLRLIIELQDGSKIIGKNGDDDFQFHSEVLGGMKVPLERIRSIESQSKTNSVQLTTANGDTLAAQFVTKTVRVETAFGSVKLPVNLIRRLTVSAVEKPGQRREGLVALWSGEGNANDVIGKNNGIATGGITYTNGEVGLAFVFNSTDAAVKVAAGPSLNVGIGGGFTIECWINPPDLAQAHPIVEWNNGIGSYGVHFYINVSHAGNLYANIVDGDGTWHTFLTGSGVITSNVFQQVALTFDKASGVAKMYCNGAVVLQQTVGSFTPQTAYDLYLGRRPLTGGEILEYAGLMDELSLYNRALSASEIQADYEAGKGGG